MDDRANTRYLKRFHVVAVSAVVTSVAMNSFAAGIVADGSAAKKQQPIITETASGVPQVNIQTPNSSGVSRNKYKQFDVGKQGAILNNSAQHSQTQLGGWVQGNSLLAGGTARIILNEVNSQNPSLLHGPVEIAGTKAQLVIANPAGISCDGCGFINAQRSTLTTGSALFNHGNLTGFDVEQGHISISGAGMDDRSSNYSDLIARTVSVNADIWANRLKITTGVNQVSHTNQLQETHNDDANKPEFSIDVAALGGMYADSIHLIGTEHGVGVRHAGRLEANTLVLEADGMLRLEGGSVIEAGQFDADVVSLTNAAGSEVTATSLQLSSSDSLTNDGLFDAQQAIISAKTINNRGTGAIYADALMMESDEVSNLSELSADGDWIAPVIAARQTLKVAANVLLNAEGAVIYSAGDAVFGGDLDDELNIQNSMAELTNQGGLIETEGNLSLSVQDLQNLNAELITEWQTDSVERIIEVQPEGWSRKYDVSRFPKIHDHYLEKQPFVDENGKFIRDFEDYTYYDYYATTQSTHLLSSKPAQLIAGGNLTIVGNVNNEDSQILAGADLTITGGSLSNYTTPGVQRVSYQGRRQFRDWEGNDEELDFYPWTSYSPAPRVTEFNLATTQVESQADTSDDQTLYSSDDIPVLSASWFQPTANSSEQFFIETDPRFSDYRDWLSSDYMLEHMAYDPSLMMKRLGDGFIEQRLVREQVAQLTGQRFLSGFADDEAQFMALMDAGVSFAEAQQLTPGVALSAEQVAMLTSDIVWLEQQQLELANGKTVIALMPKVYVKARAEDLIPGTGLLAGNKVDIQLQNDLMNTGTIAGREVVNVNSDFVQHDGQIQGRKVQLNANNIAINGGLIQGQESLELTAGEDITIASVTSQTSHKEETSRFSRTNIKRVAGLYVTGDGGELSLQAGRNLTLSAADIQQTGEAGEIRLSAANDLTLGTVKTAESNNSIHNAQDFNKHSEYRDVGARIVAKGDISLNAGNKTELVGTTINSQNGNVGLKGGEVVITNATASYQSDIATHTERDGTFSSKSKDQRDVFDESTAVASVLSGKTISVESDSDITVTGSHLVADQGLDLEAKETIKVTSAEERYEHQQYVNEEESGLLSSGGIGFTIGSQQLDVTDIAKQTRQRSSELGSLEGDVTITAGNNYVQKASNVIAVEGDINITSAKVNIESATEILRREHTTEFSQSGLSISITNPVISAVQTADQMIEAARETSDPRMKALAAAAIGLNAKNAYDSVTAEHGGNDASGADKVGGINLAISIGSSKSSSQRSETIKEAQSSKLIAGGDITIAAIGDGNNSDLTVKGSEIQAGESITLKADDALNLIAAENSRELKSKNDSSSGSVGISIGTDGLLFTVGMSKGKGKENGQDRSWTETTVAAGEKVALESGGDTQLKGAIVRGNQVTAKVGENLTIQSLQDSSVYQSEQKSSGGSISVGYGKMSGSFNSSESDINSDYASVIEQSGIKAGDHGFQIEVEGNSKLKGAVISSTQAAIDNQRNYLSTDTLVVSDIANRAEYEAESNDMGVALSYNPGESVTKNIGNNLVQLPAALTPDIAKSDSDQSRTYSAISSAEISINNEEQQITLTGKDVDSTVSSLNRDTSNANNQILAKPDIYEIKDEIEANAKIISQASKEVTIAINTIYEKRMAEYDQKYDDKINQARDKEAQAAYLEANGEISAAENLKAEAQVLRYQAVDIRNERDTPELSQGLALTLGNALVGGLGGQVNVADIATTYSVGTLGNAFLLTAQKRDSDIAQGFVAKCLLKPTDCVQAANSSNLEKIVNNADLPLTERIQALMSLKDENGNQLYDIKVVDSNKNGDFNIVSNGILNEPDRALVLGIGHLATNKENQYIYLSYNDTQGGVADLVNAAIDKYAQATSNTSQAIVEALIASHGNVEGLGETNLLAHSGGTLASNIALNQYAALGHANPNLHIDYFGPASSTGAAVAAALNAAGLAGASPEHQANWLAYGNIEGVKGAVNGLGYNNNVNDPVSTVIGGNLGQSNEYNNPESSTYLQGAQMGNILQSVLELKALFTTSDSAHSTYRWNDPSTWPTEPVSPSANKQ